MMESEKFLADHHERMLNGVSSQFGRSSKECYESSHELTVNSSFLNASVSSSIGKQIEAFLVMMPTLS